MSPNYKRRLSALRSTVARDWREWHESLWCMFLVAICSGLLAFGFHLHMRTVKLTRDDFRSLQDEADRVAGQAAAIATQHEERP